MSSFTGASLALNLISSMDIRHPSRALDDPGKLYYENVHLFRRMMKRPPMASFWGSFVRTHGLAFTVRACIPAVWARLDTVSSVVLSIFPTARYDYVAGNVNTKDDSMVSRAP